LCFDIIMLWLCDRLGYTINDVVNQSQNVSLGRGS